MEENNIVVTQQPGGICTAAGGTRKTVKLSRPWQTRIKINPETCPFEKPEEQEIVKTYDFGGVWMRLKNLYTPFPYHELIVPETCWDEERLRSLGGIVELVTALDIAVKVIEERSENKIIMGVHVGPLAGQNQGHLHYHLLSPDLAKDESPLLLGGRASEDEVHGYTQSNEHLTILESSGVKVVAGGHRVGQCFLVPKEPFAGITASGSLGESLSRVIDLYAERFRSTEGFAPDYMIGLMFREKKFRYGFYLPILNHWGTTEYFALFGEEPVILPWSHEVTVEHLQRNQ